MKDKVNSYFAILLVTIAGGGAAMLIIHAAFNNTFTNASTGTEATYAALQQSILTDTNN